MIVSSEMGVEEVEKNEPEVEPDLNKMAQYVHEYF